MKTLRRLRRRRSLPLRRAFVLLSDDPPGLCCEGAVVCPACR